MRCGGNMAKSRTQFLETSLGVLGAAAGGQTQNPTELPPGAPSAFGTGPAVAPEFSPATFSEAEKLVQFALSSADRDLASRTWRKNMAGLYERRTGPRKLELQTTVAPAAQWNPMLPGLKAAAKQDRFVRSTYDPGPLPTTDADIAFAPVT